MYRYIYIEIDFLLKENPSFWFILSSTSVIYLILQHGFLPRQCDRACGGPVNRRF